MQITNKDYKEIKDKIIYSIYYKKLSDKTDPINSYKRSINTYILANLSVGFAKEFNLNSSLAEVIVYARDIAYPIYGDISYNLFKEKIKDFKKSDYTIKILKEADIELPEELKSGIIDSFNEGNKESAEGKLIYLLENTIKTVQVNTKDEELEKYSEKIIEIWNYYINEKKYNNEEAMKHIIELTDAIVANDIWGD